MTEQPSYTEGSSPAVEAAVQAVRRGYQPIPLLDRSKKVGLSAWTRMQWDPVDLDRVRQRFTEWEQDGQGNIGLLLGEASGGLVDVDLDHPRTMRLKDHFLPPTPMRSGRGGRRNSHYWYQVEEGTLTGTRRYKMPDREVSVELRSSRSQTVVPPSVHPSGEDYLWEGEPWGGDEGPAVVDGRKLALQVAALGLTAVILDNWPKKGSRHDAYLSLAGGLLRYGNNGVHPVWEKFLPVLIHALADVTHDEDGGDTRVAEVMSTTIERLRSGEQMVAGFGKLAEIIGTEHVKQIRMMAREVENAAGFAETPPEEPMVEDLDALEDEQKADIATQPEARDPLDERITTWQAVDLDPYLAGEIKLTMPEVLQRTDGESLMYRGRVNMLYGSSETAKSWIALNTCLQEMRKGERVMFLDFEDEPQNTLSRLTLLGAGPDDIRSQFTYVRPEEPLAPMQRNKWGGENITKRGELSEALLKKAMDEINPSLIVADGMTVLYGLHGLDSNDAVSTDVITGWLKTLTRNGKSTVIIIDHTSKGAGKGSLPIGSQHKQAMVQGTLLQVWPIRQPMPGVKGVVELVLLKDRPGQVREISERSENKAQVSATITIDSSEAGHTEMTIEPPKQVVIDNIAKVDLDRSEAAEKAVQAREWEERVKFAYEGEAGKSLSMKELQDLLEAFNDPEAVRSAVKRMVEQGWLETEGNTKGRRYVFRVGVDGYSDNGESENVLQ